MQALKNLTSKEFVDYVRNRITDNRTHSPTYYEPMFGTRADFGTTHMSVISPDGDVVSWTSSINR